MNPTTLQAATITHRSRGRVWKWFVLSLGVALASLVAILVTKSEYIVLGGEAYMYGYPLVIMDTTRANAALTMGPENHLRRVRRFPNADFREVVRPNVDTLYTTAFIDMNQGPWVFELPPNAERYELMAFLDAWTDVFAALGTRTTGYAGGRFLLVGPNWQGQPPSGLTVLRSPTRMAWLIGRTHTKGQTDYPLVHRLQDGIRLRRLIDWQQDRDPPLPAWQAANPGPTAPRTQMLDMDTLTFFTRLAMLMVDNSPKAADAPMRIKLKRIGVIPGQALQWGVLDRLAVALGRRIAQWKVAQELARDPDPKHPWATPPAVLGDYGTHYNTRAVVAMVGIGANQPIDAIYPYTAIDAADQPLRGDRRYQLHFNANALPQVSAFWSITAYGKDNYLIDNPWQRHALASHDNLIYNADGSLDIWVQATPPEDERKRNWLPVKAGARFLLNARLYGPSIDVLEGRWQMPALVRID